MILANEAKLGCVVSSPQTKNKKQYKSEMQYVNKYIPIENYKLQLEKAG